MFIGGVNHGQVAHPSLPQPTMPNINMLMPPAATNHVGSSKCTSQSVTNIIAHRY